MTTPATVLVAYGGEDEVNAWLDALSDSVAARRISLGLRRRAGLGPGRHAGLGPGRRAGRPPHPVAARAPGRLGEVAAFTRPASRSA
jgi:hypothetical protein